MRQTAVIGDLHGDLQLLNRMLSDARIEARDLVFLGDYVNRGPESCGVIQRLISLRKDGKHSVTFLKGNHDEAFLAVLDGGSIVPFLQIGGSPTIMSWVPDVTGDVAIALRQHVTDEEHSFFRDLETSWASEEYIAIHALTDDTLGALLTGQMLLVGHHIQRDATPKIVDQVAYLDTGCGSIIGGRITALLLPERKFVTHQ
jgi:serine/threonine protein phosphatase 1